jgi:hypothetical protein
MPSELLVGFGPTTGNGHLNAHRGEEGNAVARLMRIIQAIKAWAMTVEDRLSKAYLASEPEGLRLFVISRNTTHDFELTKAGTLLSIMLSDAGLDLRVSQIPDGTPDELQAFLDPDAALLFTWR